MINKKSREEIKLMRHAGNIVALVHQEMARVIEPGISTLELDKIAYDIIKKNKAIPTFLGYCGYPNASYDDKQPASDPCRGDRYC